MNIGPWFKREAGRWSNLIRSSHVIGLCHQASGEGPRLNPTWKIILRSQTNLHPFRHFANVSHFYERRISGMDTEGPTRALEPSSPAELILQQKSGALQGLAQPGGNDGGILSQLLSNPFFTAVSTSLYHCWFIFGWLNWHILSHRDSV